jgi:flagellar biosynthesis/type III secretory pathway M-ring protein FliF/YscJ
MKKEGNKGRIRQGPQWVVLVLVVVVVVVVTVVVVYSTQINKASYLTYNR